MNRLNNFDAVRIIAALAVIFGHAHPLSAQPDATMLGNAVQGVAVKIFFVVSGFLVAKSWFSDPHPGRFLLRRGLRLFPALLMLLVLTVLVLGPVFTTLPLQQYFADPGTRFYFSHNLMLYPIYALPGVFADNTYPHAVNGSLWSLPVEVLMYLILPVVAGIAMLARSRGVFVALVLLGMGWSLYYLANSSMDVVRWGTGLRSALDVGPYFFIGALYATLRLERILDLGIAVVLIGFAALFQPSNYWLQQVLLMTVLPYAVLAFSTTATPFVCRAGRFGDPSYGIYLYGFPVQQMLFHVGGEAMGPLENTAWAVPIVIALAYLSWYVVEKRALSFKPSKRPSKEPNISREHVNP